ncbi:MAG: hypothetical protein ACU0DW_12540 [Shimia sp.]
MVRPAPVSVTEAIVDPRAGGAFHVVMRISGMGEMDGSAGSIPKAEQTRRLT